MNAMFILEGEIIETVSDSNSRKKDETGMCHSLKNARGATWNEKVKESLLGVS